MNLSQGGTELVIGEGYIGFNVNVGIGVGLCPSGKAAQNKKS